MIPSFLRVPGPSIMPGGCFPMPTLQSFAPSRICMLRDGGTMLVDGTINSGQQKVSIRYDGNLNSPTRGKFFIAYGPGNGELSKERRMTQTEIRMLLGNVRGMLRTGAVENPDMYRTFAKNLRRALPQPKKAALPN